MTDIDSLLATLSRYGWYVVRSRLREDLLPRELQTRYPRLPAELETFLSNLELCCNSKDTVWFLTRENYHPTPDDRFHWNEHELMSLAAADDNGEMARIRAYWDCHFPFLFAVHSDYDYLAVDLRHETYGQIVHGYMPEPEQSSLVARSFMEFVQMFAESLRGNAEYPLSCFI